MICTIYVYSENCAQAGRVVPGSAILYANAEEREQCDGFADNGDLSAWEFPTWVGMRAFFEGTLAALPANAANDYTRRVARSILDEIEGLR